MMLQLCSCILVRAQSYLLLSVIVSLHESFKDASELIQTYNCQNGIYRQLSAHTLWLGALIKMVALVAWNHKQLMYCITIVHHNS